MELAQSAQLAGTAPDNEIEVTPEQAEALSLASHQTTIQLLLCNPFDREAPKAPVYPADAPPPPPNKSAKPVLVEP